MYALFTNSSILCAKMSIHSNFILFFFMRSLASLAERQPRKLLWNRLPKKKCKCVLEIRLFLVFTSVIISIKSNFLPAFCTVEFETWHLQLIAGLVILISSSRYLLLKTWPEFAESSKAANQQVSSILLSVPRTVSSQLLAINFLTLCWR